MSHSSQRVIVTVNGREYQVELQDIHASPVIAVVDGQRFEVYIVEDRSDQGQESVRVLHTRQERDAPSKPVGNEVGFSPVKKTGNSTVVAPLPGDIVEVFVQPGQIVEVGDPLCVLEAMKMKNIIHSPRTGRISSVDIHRGQSVEYGDSIVTYE